MSALSGNNERKMNDSMTHQDVFVIEGTIRMESQGLEKLIMLNSEEGREVGNRSLGAG